MCSPLTSSVSLGALIGSLVTYAGNQAFPDVTDNRGWRVPLYVGLAAPTLALIFQAFTATESPYWLVLKNRRDAAEHNLHRLFPSKTQAEIEDEVNLLVYTVEKEMEERAERASVSFFDCFKGVELRRTFVATLPTLAQQLTGNQLVQSYSTYFFTVAGISDALAASSVVSALGLAGAICAFFIVEKKVIGRFWLVFLGMIAVTICMLGIGVVDSASHGNIGKSGGYVLVFFVGLFNLAVAIGPGVAGWAYTAEAANVRLRAKTTAIATGANAIVGGFWNVVLPYELTAIGPKTGYMFFGIGVLCCIVIWFGIPDLTGRTYAQMDELFERKIPAREFSKTECTGDYGNNEETTV
jgi:MFS family permease